MTALFKRTADSAWFQNFITAIILLAGVVVGVEPARVVAVRQQDVARQILCARLVHVELEVAQPQLQRRLASAPGAHHNSVGARHTAPSPSLAPTPSSQAR